MTEGTVLRPRWHDGIPPMLHTYEVALSATDVRYLSATTERALSEHWDALRLFVIARERGLAEVREP